MFVDAKGQEFPAMVEFAPYQKYSKKSKSRIDNKAGTIDEDPDYVKFLKSIEEEERKTAAFTPEQHLDEIENKYKERGIYGKYLI